MSPALANGVKWSAPTTELIIIRGLRGTGKSTLAKRIRERASPNGHAWEEDKCPTVSAGPIFKRRWCFNRSLFSVRKGFTPVIIANVFYRNRDMIPYFHMCRQYGLYLRIFELHTQFTNPYGSEAMLIEARRKFQPLDRTRLVGIKHSVINVLPGGPYGGTA